MANSVKEFPERESACYQIRIRGRVSQIWSDWFIGMAITTQAVDGKSQMTLLTGPIADQSALRGILCKIWDLNLTVLSVSEIEMNSEHIEGEK
jgi:hypothetical protein